MEPTLVEIRKEKGLHQQVLADAIGMSQSTFSYKEKTGTFTEEERKKIAKVLKTDMQTIVWTSTTQAKHGADEKDRIISAQRDQIKMLEGQVKTLTEMVNKLLENR